MKIEDLHFNLPRRIGNTYNLLNNLADSIQDGQPMAILVFNTYMEAKHHLPMLIKILKRRGIKPKYYNCQRYLICDNSIIHILSRGNYESDTLGLPVCDFIDHHALDEMTPMQLTYMLQRLNRTFGVKYIPENKGSNNGNSH